MSFDLSPKQIDESIVSESYHCVPRTLLVSCRLTLRDGRIVTGECGGASNESLGRQLAREDARQKICL